MSKRAILVIGTIIAITNFITFDFASFLAAEAKLNQATSSPTSSLSNTPEPEVKRIGDPIDIRNIPVKIWERQWANSKDLPYTVDYNLFFDDASHTTRPVVYRDQRIISLEYAPETTVAGESQLGFMYDVEKDGFASEVVLAVMNTDTSKVKEVYHGDYYRTSNWEWDGSDHIIIYHSCGTACRFADKINVKTGKEVDSWEIVIPIFPPSPSIDPK